MTQEQTGLTLFFNLIFFLATLTQDLGLCGWLRPNLIGGCRFRASTASVPESGSYSVPGSLGTGHLDEASSVEAFCIL
uniref:Putative secreted protein n=1 Tax=Ixodes ricinus TaxID=34613 RepID=A0A6B0U0F8_IXORI